MNRKLVIIGVLFLACVALAQWAPPGMPTASGGGGASSGASYWVDAGIESSGGVFPGGGSGSAQSTPSYVINQADQTDGIWLKQKSTGAGIATGLAKPALTIASVGGSGLLIPGIQFRGGFQYNATYGYIFGSNYVGGGNINTGMNIAGDKISFLSVDGATRYGYYDLGTGGGFISEVAAGQNAMTMTNTGARLKLSTGVIATDDYLYSDSVGVATPSYFKVGTFTDAGLPATPVVGAIAYGLSTGGLKVGTGSTWADLSLGGSSGSSYFYDAGIAGAITTNEVIYSARVPGGLFNQTPANMAQALQLRSPNSGFYTTPSIAFYTSAGVFMGDIVGNDAYNGNQLRSGINIRAQCGSGADCGINFSSVLNDATYASFQGAGLYMRYATSGQNAIVMQNTGARVDLSESGSLDFLDSDGTNVRTGGGFKIGGSASAAITLTPRCFMTSDGGTVPGSGFREEKNASCPGVVVGAECITGNPGGDQTGGISLQCYAKDNNTINWQWVNDNTVTSAPVVATYSCRCFNP